MNNRLKYGLLAAGVFAAAGVTMLFSCRHSKVGNPITPRFDRRGRFKTYVTCMNCGKELGYDLKDMRIITILEEELERIRKEIYHVDHSQPIAVRDGLLSGDLQQDPGLQGT